MSIRRMSLIIIQKSNSRQKKINLGLRGTSAHFASGLKLEGHGTG